MFRILLFLVGLTYVLSEVGNLDIHTADRNITKKQSTPIIQDVELTSVFKLHPNHTISLPSYGTTTESGMSFKLPLYDTNNIRFKRSPVSQEQGCNVVINELMTMHQGPLTVPYQQFIELTESCGRRAKPKKLHSTDGYVLLMQQRRVIGTVVQNGLIFYADLKGKSFRSVESEDKHTDFFFTIGEAVDPKVDMTFLEAETTGSPTNRFSGAIPAESDEPISILLLKFTVHRERLLMGKLKLKRLFENGFPVRNGFEFTPLTEEANGIIKTHLVDQFVFGKSCPSEVHQFYKQINIKFPDDCDEVISSSELTASPEALLASYSRCSPNNSPFNCASFRQSVPTAGKKNLCQSGMLNHPHNFAGKALQHTAMKLLLNSLYSIKVSASDPSVLEGGAIEVVARLHGVSTATIKRTNKRERNNALVTPGAKRKRVSKTLIQIDEFDRNWITQKIKESYKRGIAAEARQLYKDFMSYKREPINTPVNRLCDPSSAIRPVPQLLPVAIIPGTPSRSNNPVIRPSIASLPACESNPINPIIGHSSSTNPVNSRTVGSSSTQPITPQTGRGSLTDSGNPQVGQSSTTILGTTQSTVSTTATPNTNSLPQSRPFTCSYSTFRRLLILMGYKYGLINARAAVMQRPELTRWRGLHLKSLKQNDESERPKKLVYLDETWIDPHVRLAKGWAPEKCTSFRDMAAYSYSKHKIGRGPRLIVFAAVTEDEVIQESIRVYKIHKTKTADDYHQNVDSKAFTGWMKDLSTVLKRKGGEYIFVMDNASYHSQKTIPKKSEKKHVLYQWLKDNEQRSGLVFDLKDEKIMRKWELEDLVIRAAAQPQMQQHIFTLDKMLTDDGHEVRRLPPYHCHLNPIEMVWGVVKRKIAQENTDQNLDTIKALAEKHLREYNLDTLKNQFKHVKRLREELWKDDGIFESVEESSITIDLSHDDDDSDDEYEESDEEDESSATQDNIPYADDIWQMVDDIDLSSDVFTEEIELGGFMKPRPSKRARCNNVGIPLRLAFDENE